LGCPRTARTATGGVIMLALGLLPKMSALVETLPQVVLGGAGLVMFGMVAATGARILTTVDFKTNRFNLFVVAISIGFGMIPLVAPNFFRHTPDALHPLLESGILLAAMVSVLLNLFFNGVRSVEAAQHEASMTAGIEMVHVPYRGSAPMVTDLLGGQVQAALDNLLASVEYIRTGKLRALAVTSATRWQALPDIPTLADFQPGFEAYAWVGIGVLLRFVSLRDLGLHFQYRLGERRPRDNRQSRRCRGMSMGRYSTPDR
jgi:Tripartite tricarboxylate transporter family receptor/Permease family